MDFELPKPAMGRDEMIIQMLAIINGEKGFIAGIPVKWYQGKWCAMQYEGDHPCGTTLCLAGEASALAYPKEFQNSYTSRLLNDDARLLFEVEGCEQSAHMEEIGRELLGLNEEQSDNLFYSENSEEYVSSVLAAYLETHDWDEALASA